MKFDLSSVTDLNITSAKLFLYCTKARNPPSDLEVDVHETGDAWDEDTITWSIAPAVGSFVAANMTVGEKDKYYSWDISSYFFAQLAGDQNLSLVVKLPLDDPLVNNPDQERDFASSENSDPNKRPYIEVTYERPPPVASFTFSPPSPQVNETVTFNASGSYAPDPVGKTLTAFFTYTMGTYSSYNLVETLVDDIESADCGSVEVYDNGTYMFIKSDIWSKPYLAYGELDKDGDHLIDPTATDKNGDGIIDRYDLKSDGITITGIGTGYDWYVDSDINGNPTKQRDPEITVPSWDLNLSSGGILDGSIEYYAAIPVPTNQTTFNVEITVHASPPDPDYVPPKPLIWIVSYTWDFGDGTPLINTTDPVINHTYTAYGTYNVTLNVTDSEGRWDTETKTITVRAHPHADFSWTPVSPQAGDPVTFNASASTPDGGNLTDPDSYAWDFGDGNNGIGMIVNHTYATAGVYNVTLAVTDSEGKNDTAWHLVNVTSPLEERFLLTVRTDPSGLSPQPTRDPSGVSGPTPDSWWYANCTYVNLTAPEYANVSADTRYRFDYWDVDGANVSGNPITVHMDANHTATAHYILQYLVTFNQTGLDATALGTVVTVNGAPKNFSDLPFFVWVDNGSSVTYNYNTIVSSTVSGKRFRLDSISSPPSPFIVTGPVTITGNYKTQYLLTVRTNGIGTNVTNVYNGTTILGTATDATPYTSWFDEGSSLQLNIDSPITVGSTRFVFTQWSGDATGTSRPLSVSMDSAKDITANYKTQYEVTFSQSGVGTDFTGTVVTIDGTGYNVTDLPVSFWWDNNSQHNFSFASPLVVNATKQYIWMSTSGLSTLQSGTLTITGSGNVIGIYTIKTQYLITFDQTGIGLDFTGAVVTIDGVNYSVGSLPASFWWEAGSSHNFTFQSPLVVTPNGKRYVWTSTTGLSSLQSGSITVSMSGNIVGNYKTQYYLTLETNPSGITTPSGEGWYDAGAYAPISTPEFVPGGSRYRFDGWTTGNMSEITDPDLPSTTVLMDEAKTVTANYVTQYKVTFTQTGLFSDATGTVVTVNSSAKAFGDLPFEIWVDSGGILIYSYEATVSSTVSGKQFRLDTVTGPTSPITVTADTTVTGNYVIQYQVTFAQTGLDATATGTVATVNGTAKTFSELPYTTWVDSGDSVSYSYNDPVLSSAGGKRFKLVNVTGPASPITVTSPVAVTGNYKTRYEIMFDQSGVGSDFTGTVVVIDATDYSFGSLPVSFWWDAGSSHDFAFQSPLVVTPSSKRYLWTSTSGLSSLQSDSITVSASGNITGNYGTQYYLTVTSPYGSPTPSSGWFDDGDEITASVTSPWPGATGVRYVCTGWTGTGSVPSSGTTTSVTFTINASSSITWNWKTQYYLTVMTDPIGLSPAPTPSSNWYDESQDVQLTAPDPSYKGATEYQFNYWDVDGGSQGSGVNPITVHMDNPHTATAHYQPVAPPPPPAVGGHALPINLDLGASNSLIPQIGLASILSATLSATIILVRRRKKTSKREH